MGKYRLRRHNCIQETDSEERRDALLEKGYVLERVEGKPAGTAATLEERLQEAEEYAERANREIGRLEKENTELKKEAEELKKKSCRTGEGKRDKADSKGFEQELKDA